MPSSLRMLVRPLGIFLLSRLALLGAVEVARRFLILPSVRPDPACVLGICEPNGWVPLVLAALAMGAGVAALWTLVQRDEGAGAAGSAVLLFLASPLSLVLALDAAAAAATALSLLALGLAPRRTWAAGLALAGATVLAPVAALMAPALMVAAWAEDFRGMRVNAVLAGLPALAVLGLAGLRGAIWSPLVSVPWLRVESLVAVPGAPGSLIHSAAIAVLLGVCLLAFARGRFVAGLAGAPWLAAGLALGGPIAAHLGACAVAPWGPAAALVRKWELEAPLAGGLFMVQGLWLFHLVHGFRIL